ncbi:MAG: sugar phosphate isomerase/epimerase [Anaerolineae bacterium]|nr:sugar phosphate isomerase/epimerase [Anaerolineae bacterium]
MTKYGAHAFVWVGDWNPALGTHAIQQAGEQGFDFIEIPMLRPEEFDTAIYIKALADAGIYATVSLVLPADAHMPHQPDRAVAFLTRVLDNMEALGSTYLGGCIAYHLGTLTGAPPTPAEKQAVIDGLGAVAHDARRRGITLALEACNRYETYMFNTLADTYQIIKAIGAPNLKLHADTYHMNIEEENFHDPIVATADRIDYIHMSESHRGLVGNGTVKWDEVFSGLADANYRGPLVLESFAAINPDLARATCLWRPPKQSPEELARRGLEFLKLNAAKYGLT